MAEWQKRCDRGVDVGLSADQVDDCLSETSLLICADVYREQIAHINWPTCSEVDAINYHEYPYGTVGWSCEVIGDQSWARAVRCGSQTGTREQHRDAFVRSCCSDAGVCSQPSRFSTSLYGQQADVHNCDALLITMECGASPTPEASATCSKDPSLR
jgi:hypothetical protein